MESVGQIEDSLEDPTDATTPVTQQKTFKKRKHISKPARKKKLGDQLTYQSEQNVLAEIDIYAFLGKVNLVFVLLENHPQKHNSMYAK